MQRRILAFVLLLSAQPRVRKRFVLSLALLITVGIAVSCGGGGSSGGGGGGGGGGGVVAAPHSHLLCSSPTHQTWDHVSRYGPLDCKAVNDAADLSRGR